MKKYATTEALFGSLSRGDSDQLSDRDILIVDGDVSTLRLRKAELEAEGYSVAAYTWRKLKKLCGEGALFVQHLKLESRIIRDEGNKFSKLVGEFRPKESYEQEIQSNRQLASVVLNYPATVQGMLWVADVLYVCLRNFGVLALAERGKFTFSFHSILDELVLLNLLHEADAKSLRQLRLMKTLFRDGASVPIPRVINVLSEILNSMPTEVLGRACRSCSPFEIVSNALIMPKDASSYHRLRNLEKVYIGATALNPSVKNDAAFVRLRRWIEDPRTYAGFAKRNEASLVESIKLFVLTSRNEAALIL